MLSCMNMPYNEIKPPIYKHVWSLVRPCLRVSTSRSTKPLSIKFVLQRMLGSVFPHRGGWQFYGHWSHGVFSLECLCVRCTGEVCVAVTATQSQALQLTAVQRSALILKLRSWLLSWPRRHGCSWFNLLNFFGTFTYCRYMNEGGVCLQMQSMNRIVHLKSECLKWV